MLTEIEVVVGLIIFGWEYLLKFTKSKDMYFKITYFDISYQVLLIITTRSLSTRTNELKTNQCSI